MSDKKNKKSKLKAWLDGDMLLSPFLQRNTGMILLVFVLSIAYVSNRYGFQREQVEIKKLRDQLEDVRYKSLARTSELMEKSRESNIQKFIVEQGSELKVSTLPPVVIKK